MSGEIWKDVIGYEGIYAVSSLGRIKNIKTGNEMAQEKNWAGYIRVGLSKNNKQKKYSVHRLVAEAFIPNTYGKPQVNHIDENKSNNCVSNLEWVTQKENHNRGTVNQRISKSLINNPKKSKRVGAYDDNQVLIKEFPSVYEAGRQMGISAASIRDCIYGRNRAKHAGGYVWRFL